MIGHFFSGAAAKIFGISTLFLFILLGIQTWRLSSEKSDHEKTRFELKATAAERDRFEADAQRMVDEGAARMEKGQAALKEQESRSTETRRQIIRIQRAAPSKDCLTPKEVLDANL